ncbi:MAG: Gfo/Idh/MocA family oxidoreductase [Verrucomicrobia bacterium]|nr:Gfo/Idh/MocA family oxidoreductase [Verrucomicrobiota bacterium]
MSLPPSTPPADPAAPLSRRRFLRTASAAVLGGSMLGSLAVPRGVFADSSETIKIALVGCGGRGTGAANQALSTPGPTQLIAMADVRPEQLTKSLATLTAHKASQVDVPPERQFTDFDGYQKAIALADIVILATSPGFRPIHFQEAVRQGKHVFMEKPVATDAPGVRRVLAAAQTAKEKNLKVGVGLQRHHQPGYLETIKRLQDGAVGKAMSFRCYWDGTSRDGVDREPGETEMHYQIRNWYYFTWLSGDHIVEQHVHNIDVINWMKGAHPVRAQGMGGRQVRKAKRHGQIFDHHFVEFEYADGTRMFSQCRQIPRCWPSVSEHVLGTEGEVHCQGNRFAITGPQAWQYRNEGKRVDPYQQEHDDLFDAIRHDKPYHEAEYGALSTMTGILGRMCTYSGQQITWEEAINSRIDLLPKTFSWDTLPLVLPNADGYYPVAVPGQTVCV